MKIIKRLLNSRFWTLAIKEINQILRNKQLVILLIIPPTIQLLLYGFTLNPDVHNLKLGVVNYSHSYESRQLVSALTSENVFVLDKYISEEQELSQKVQSGQLKVGIVIPPDFKKDKSTNSNIDNKNLDLKILIDGVDANTAGIAKGYIHQILNQYNLQFSPNQAPELINPQITFLYNNQLVSSWYYIPAILGVVLTLIATLVSSLVVVREKDTGTLEQLLMTPAAAWEILLAKIVPLFLLLMGDVIIGLHLGKLVFGVPVRGNIALFLGLSGVYLFVAIGLGMMLATICRTQQQVVLISFFINIPLIQLSGGIAPIKSMPIAFQYLTLLNPLRYYIEIARGILLKGVGLEVLWTNAAAILIFAIVVLSISVNKFRSQLN
jgi:ABC-2 type transport system permease protein